MLLHTDSFTHNDTFTHSLLYTRRLLHRDASTHQHFYTKRLCFYTQTLLRKNTFTHRRFYTQTLLHTDAFTHRFLYTQMLSHTDAFYAQTLLHTDTFTHERFYTQTLLHANAFTHTQALLHTKRFRDKCTHKRTHTQTYGHTNKHTHRHYIHIICYEINKWKNIYIYTRTHTDAHAHTHTDTHTQTDRHTKCAPNLGGPGVKESMKIKSCCCSTCHGHMDVVICCKNFIYKGSMVWAKQRQDHEISDLLGAHLISEISGVKGSNGFPGREMRGGADWMHPKWIHTKHTRPWLQHRRETILENESMIRQYGCCNLMKACTAVNKMAPFVHAKQI